MGGGDFFERNLKQRPALPPHLGCGRIDVLGAGDARVAPDVEAGEVAEGTTQGGHALPSNVVVRHAEAVRPGGGVEN